MRFSRLSSRCWRRLSVAQQRFSTLLLLLAATGSVTGCGGTRVSLTASDAIVRAGPDVSGRIYVWNGSAWELSANKVTVPEGWWIGHVPVGDSTEDGPPVAEDFPTR